jgi:class 3 adenylate cyclase
MTCTKCKTENPEGLKFCIECGGPLKAGCAACGFENLPRANYCGQCGAPLSPPSAQLTQSSGQAPVRIAGAPPADCLDGERKTVTALFADIKGSMDLMEDLDPEEARATVDPALKLMMDAVHHFGGYVAQSTGDGIFALFGAPVAHEDYPQRALYTKFLSARRSAGSLWRISTSLRSCPCGS